MDFSQLIDKIIELANTPGGAIAGLVISIPLALWLVGGYSKRRAEAFKLDAEAKKIRAQGDADSDLAETKNTAKILDIMERLTSNDTEKNRMIQLEFEKRREEGELNRKTLEKVSTALLEFNSENKAWRFDFKTNSHIIDGSLLNLTSKIESMAGTLITLEKETDDSHLWMRSTIAEMHTQLGVIYRLATRPDKPTPTPPTEPDSATPRSNITPLDADGAKHATVDLPDATRAKDEAA